MTIKYTTLTDLIDLDLVHVLTANQVEDVDVYEEYDVDAIADEITESVPTYLNAETEKADIPSGYYYRYREDLTDEEFSAILEKYTLTID